MDLGINEYDSSGTISSWDSGQPNKISINITPNNGNCFTIELPAYPDESHISKELQKYILTCIATAVLDTVKAMSNDAINIPRSLKDLSDYGEIYGKVNNVESEVAVAKGQVDRVLGLADSVEAQAKDKLDQVIEVSLRKINSHLKKYKLEVAKYEAILDRRLAAEGFNLNLITKEALHDKGKERTKKTQGGRETDNIRSG